MVQLFTFLCIPLIIGYTISSRKNRSGLFVEISSAFLCSLPLTLLILILRRSSILQINWASNLQIISVTWFLDFAFPMGISYLCYVHLLRWKIFSPKNSGFIWGLSFFSFPVIMRSTYNKNILGLYEYFYYPVVCVVLVYLCSVWLAYGNTQGGNRQFDNKLYVCLSLFVFTVGSSILPTLTAYAYYMHRELLAFMTVILQIVIIAAGLIFSKFGRKVILG